VLDATNYKWFEISRLEPDRVQVTGRAVVSAGRKLLVFGGRQIQSHASRGQALGRRMDLDSSTSAEAPPGNVCHPGSLWCQRWRDEPLAG
jgi:hypothetical protein